MGIVGLPIFLAVCIATTASTPFSDLLFESNPRVRIVRKNALLPCACADQVLDCSERGKLSLSAEDRCQGRVAVLNLNGNKLNIFPDGFLEATTVNISGNLLKTLPLQSQLNPQLKRLDLSDNEIINPIDNGFGSLGSLETLIVSNNYQLGTLRFLPRPCTLRHLEANKINLQDIQNSLSECTLLETLHLSRNSLTTLQERTFSSLTRLRVLDLARNSIEAVPNRLFNGLSQLRSLDLHFNRLRTLPSDVFNCLSNLKELNLRGNLFTSLPSGLFSPLSRLTHLNLANTPFESFPNEISNLPSLEELQLALNGLTSLPENSFSSLPRLKELILMYNNISSLPNTIFSGLSNLKSVSLANNPISTLPSDIFSGAPNLDFVMLPCVEFNRQNLQLVRNVTSVVYANCGSIELRSGVLSELSRAENLIINENTITLVAEDAFHGLPQLQLLDLSGNKIRTLPVGVFSQLTQVQRIYLMSNRLATVPEGLFSGLLNLKAIVLSHNHFREVPENLFQRLQALESVDLSINSLTTLPPNLFAGLPSLKEVNVEDNLLTALPSFNPVWGSIPTLAFGYNSNLSLDAASLRPWLAQGSRYLSVEGTSDEAVRPASLAWLLQEPGVALSAGSPRGCHCGVARRGGVLLHLCVAMRCEGRPRHPDDWLLAALRQANGSVGATQVA